LIHLQEEESNEDPQETEKLIAHLGEAIQTLKQEQKICVELFYLKKRSYQEISDQLGIDLKQVKSAIQNGKRNLKLKLEAIHEKQI
jgi:RNA polymerase sigma factor (sigma-70 family)